MTVTATESTVDYEGDGVTTSWPVNFPAEAKSDFLLWLIDEDDVMTVVDAADFDIVFNADQTSTITYPNSGSPLASGLTLYIERAVPYTQPTYIANQRKFYATSLQEGLDRAVMQIQQVKTEVNKLKRRALRLGDGDFGNLNAITNKSARANFAVGFDSNGQVSLIPNGSISDEWTSAVVNFKVYNPNDSRWGAIGDGVTDDTTEVQDCFDDLVLAGGGILEFTHLHRVTAPIVVSTDVPIFISSPNVYIGGLICDHGGDAIRLNLGTVGVAAAPRIISVGIWKASGAASGGTAIKINYSDLNSGSYKGIELLGNFISRIGSSYFTNAVDLTRCTHATLERNFIQGQGGTASTKVGSGVNLNTWCQGLTVHNNKIRGFLHGLLIDDISVEVAEDFQSEGYSIRGNTVSNCTNGLTSTLTATEVSWVIEANSFDCTLRGLSLDNIIRTQIVNNRFGWNGGHTDHADIFLQRTDGSSSVASTLQSIVNSNRAFRKGDLELRITGVTRGATTTLSYTTASKTRNITAISKTNPCVVTYAGGDAFFDDDNVVLAAILGMTELNGYTGRISNVNTTANTFELPGVDATGFTAYTSGGTASLSNGTGTIANDDILYVYGIGGTVELNRKPIKVASLNTGAGTFVAKDYETGADIVSTNYGAFSSNGTTVRYGRFLEVKGGAGVDASGNQITFRNCGYHLWAQTKDVYWGFNRVIGEDGSSSIRGINNSSNPGTLMLLPFGAADYIIRDGGAAGDGVTDDTACLQSVLSAGKSIFLDPAKTYLLKDQLVITTAGTGINGNGATIKISTASGDFRETSFANKYTATAVPIYATGIDRPFVKDCRITTTAFVDDIYIQPIYFINCTNIDISGNEIWNFSRGPGRIVINDCASGNIKYNYVHNCYTNTATGSADQAQVTAILVDETSVTPSTDLTISWNRGEYLLPGPTAFAAFSSQADLITICGNVSTTRFTPSRDHIISNNRGKWVGDLIDCWGSDCTISNNYGEYCYDNLIKIMYGGSRNNVYGNTGKFLGRYGIHVAGTNNADVGDCDRNHIHANKLSGWGWGGSWISGDGTTKMWDAEANGVAQSITAIAKTTSTSVTVTYSGADTYAAADRIWIHNVLGMTQINDRDYIIQSVDTVANTFVINTPPNGSWGAYTSGGTIREGQHPWTGGVETAGIHIDLVINGVTWRPTNTLIEGNDLDGMDTGVCGVRGGSYTGGAGNNICRNNNISRVNTYRYRDANSDLLIDGGLKIITTATFTVEDGIDVYVVDYAAGTCTGTFPNAARELGRTILVITQNAQAVVSASANVVPRAGGAAGTALVPNTDGAWSEIKSNRTSWQIIRSS